MFQRLADAWRPRRKRAGLQKVGQLHAVGRDQLQISSGSGGGTRVLRSQASACPSAVAEAEQAARAEALFEQAAPAVADAILKHHAVLNSAAPLAHKLARLPAAAHMAACRSCIAEGDDAWPLHLGDAWDAASQLLARAPECTAVHVVQPSSLPHAQATPRVAALALRIAAAPRVRSLRVNGALDVDNIATLAMRLTALTALDLLCAAEGARGVPFGASLAMVWPHVRSLTQLRRLGATLAHPTARDSLRQQLSADARVLAGLTALTLSVTSGEALRHVKRHVLGSPELVSLSVCIIVSNNIDYNRRREGSPRAAGRPASAAPGSDITDDTFYTGLERRWPPLCDFVAATYLTALTGLRVSGGGSERMALDVLPRMSALTQLQESDARRRYDDGAARGAGRAPEHADGAEHPRRAGLVHLRTPELCSACTAAVAGAVGALTQLTSLSLAVDLPWDKGSAQEFAKYHRDLSRVQHLELPTQDCFGDMHAALLAEIGSLPRLRAVSYDERWLKGHTASRANLHAHPAALSGLAAATQLTQLHIPLKRFGCRKVHGIERLTQLQSLWMCSSQFSSPTCLAALTQLRDVRLRLRSERPAFVAVAGRLQLSREASPRGLQAR